MQLTNVEKAFLAALIAAHGASANPMDKHRNPFAKFSMLGDPTPLTHNDDAVSGFSSLESASDSQYGGASKYSHKDLASRMVGVRMNASQGTCSSLNLSGILSGVQSIFSMFCSPGSNPYGNTSGCNPNSANPKCPFSTCPRPPGGGSPPPTGGSPPSSPYGGSPPGPPGGMSPPPTGGSPPGSPYGGSPPGSSAPPPGGGYKRSVERRDVYNKDERKEACNTNVAPYAHVGGIGVKGQKDTCTGTLIGPRTVLTAAHCVHAGGTGSSGWMKAEDLMFHQYVRSNCDEDPKVITFEASTAWALQGWTEHRDPNFDLAVITLKTNDTKRGYMSISSGDYALDSDDQVNMIGFPSDKEEHTMWSSHGALKNVTERVLKYDLDTAAGTSGAGLYVFNTTNSNRNIVAVHNGNYGDGENKINVGTRIDKINFHMLCYWLDHAGTHIDGCP